MRNTKRRPTPTPAPIPRSTAQLALGLLALLLLPSGCASAEPVIAPRHGAVLLSPCRITDDELRITLEEGLVFVPENRTAESSRTIAVHFLRIPCLAPSGKAPVFFLAGGPGGSFSEDWVNETYRGPDRYSKVLEMVTYAGTRDVVLVNQRGNPRAPGLQSGEAVFFTEAIDFDRPFTFEEAGRLEAEGLTRAVKEWTARGVDLAGYDIRHYADDIDAIRSALGYETLALRGSSFGSQCGLAYMQRHPNRVERALFHGVEPLDHAYDSPEGIWRTMERIDELARLDPTLVLPEGGLLNAWKEIVQRLEEAPVKIRGRHPRRDFEVDLVIGPDDFRRVRFPRLGRSFREMVAFWPKYITEIHGGDYRYLASLIVDDRPETFGGYLSAELVDGSLGISAEREAQLAAQTEPLRWLGDPNWGSAACRSALPVTVLSPEEKDLGNPTTPVLFVHGDLDLSTPFENALELKAQLPNSYMIHVHGGSHGAAGDMIGADSSAMDLLSEFIDQDTSPGSMAAFFASLPSDVELAPLNFRPTSGPALFETEVRQ